MQRIIGTDEVRGPGTDNSDRGSGLDVSIRMRPERIQASWLMRMGGGDGEGQRLHQVGRQAAAG